MCPYVRISSASSILPALAGAGPEDLPSVVEQGDVGRGPADVLDALGPWPMEGADLRLGQRAGGGEVQQSRRAEQVVEQLSGRERRPHPLEGGADVGQGAEGLAHVGGGDRLPPPGGGQRGEHFALDEPPPGVVAPEASPGCLDDARRVGDGEADEPGAERHPEVGPERALAVGDGLVDDRRHPGVPLDPGGELGVALVARARPAHVGDEVGQHDLLDTGLAERREHPLDVAQEHPVRSDDEDALILQREAVGVQQICRAVEGDDGLAGARTALDHEHTGLRRADDLVLLGLDRGDDVAERPGAAALEGGEQGRVATQGRPLRHEPVIVADAEVPAAEQLVLDAEHLPSLDREVPPPDETHRLAAGRAVEGLGDRCPPVDDDRVGLLVGHGQAADVEALRRGRALGIAVDPPEHQCGVAEVEVGQALDQGFVEGVAFEAGLERAPEVGLVEISEPPC